MSEIINSITNGQWTQVLEQMDYYNITFKELADAGVSARDIAILADMKG